jgi:hypothetical protein
LYLPLNLLLKDTAAEAEEADQQSALNRDVDAKRVYTTGAHGLYPCTCSWTCQCTACCFSFINADPTMHLDDVRIILTSGGALKKLL